MKLCVGLTATGSGGYEEMEGLHRSSSEAIRRIVAELLLPDDLAELRFVVSSELAAQDFLLSGLELGCFYEDIKDVLDAKPNQDEDEIYEVCEVTIQDAAQWMIEGIKAKAVRDAEDRCAPLAECEAGKYE